MINESLLKNKKELYNKLLPALFSKRKEIYLNFHINVKEEDIWNYLVIHKWKDSLRFDIFDMTSDILYIDNFLIKDYVLNLNNSLDRKTSIISIK